jgi:uncharacterized Fe-S cluster-containing radical SAM superfamily enzyme
MLTFEDLVFSEVEEKIRVTIYKYFYIDLEQKEIEKTCRKFLIKNNTIVSEKFDQEHIAKKFMRFFAQYKNALTFNLNGNPAYYVDEDFGIPLIGLNFMGVVDKGSEMLEIKPISGMQKSSST